MATKGTLGTQVLIIEALLANFNKGKIKAFKDGQPDNSMFQICAAFLAELYAEDGQIDLARADLDKIDSLYEYVVAATSVSTEEVMVALNADRVGHLTVIK